MGENDAIDVALALTRQPGQRSHGSRRPLPGNMIEVIRLAADHSETVERYSKNKGVSSQLLTDAARFYLQKIIIESGPDHHRALALMPDATAEQVRDHKRLLLKWLHPDLNHNSWESGLFLRVQRAAEALEQPREEVIVKPHMVRDATKERQQQRHAKRSKVSAPLRPRRRALNSFMRTVGLPTLTIAGSAAMIYLVVSNGPASVFTKDKFLSLLHWQTK